MKAIEVLVNGKRLCVAGSGRPEFTFATITLRDGDQAATDLMVAGGRGKMVVMWIDDYPINDGDEVLLRIVEADETDPPIESGPKWTEFPQIKLPQ